jgi:putative addiction module CopG family antidote
MRSSILELLFEPITVMGQGNIRGVAMAISADVGTKLEKYVTKLVEQGRYNSKSEVVREGIRLVQEREARFAILDAAVEKGLKDIREYAAMAKRVVA